MAVRVIYLAAGYYYHFADVRKHHLETAVLGLVILGIGLVAVAPSAARGIQPVVRLHPSRTGPLGAGVAILAAFALYHPILELGFLSDDYVLWSRAVAGEFVTSGAEFFRPLPLIVWNVIGSFAPMPSPVLHATNILLHGVNTFLTYYLSSTLGFSRVQAGVCAAIFLVWPTHLEAVVWCSGIQDVLMTTFVLAAMTAPLWTLPFGVTAILFIGLLVAGAASKETAVVAPVLFVTFWFGRLQRASSFMLLAFAAAAITIVSRLQFGLAEGYLTPPSRYLLKEMLSRLSSGLAMPMTNATLEHLPHLGFGTVTLLSLGTASAFSKWTTERSALGVAVRGALWALASILPVYGYFFIGPDLEGSRYLYLATFGWAVLLVQLASTAIGTSRRAGRASIVVLICIVGAGAVYSRRQLERWQSAAGLRDEVLRAAYEAARRSDCETVSLKQPPDSVNGVYVFRNGFYEAIAIDDRTAFVKSRIVPQGPCEFVWRDGSFVEQR